MEHKIIKIGKKYYQVYPTGQIIDLKTMKRKPAVKTHLGYCKVSFWQTDTKKNITLYLHRILAENFIPNPEGKPFVNHMDGNPSNNKLSNLEWTTNAENIQHAYDNNLIKRTKKKDK